MHIAGPLDEHLVSCGRPAAVLPRSAPPLHPCPRCLAKFLMRGSIIAAGGILLAVSLVTPYPAASEVSRASEVSDLHSILKGVCVPVIRIPAASASPWPACAEA